VRRSYGRLLLTFTLVVGLLAAGLTARASTVTYTNSPGTSAVGSLGAGGDLAYGETFTLADSAMLDSLSFYELDAGQGNVELVLQSWNGSAATGPVVYTSAATSLANDVVQFNSIDTALQAGSYVAYMTVSGVSDPATSTDWWLAPSNGGLVGPMVYTPVGSAPSGPNEGWATLVGSTPYLEYQATFTTPVPLPTSLWLLASASALLGAQIFTKRILNDV
jgi:hypothetical protein